MISSAARRRALREGSVGRMPEADEFMTVAEVASIPKLNQQTVAIGSTTPGVHIGQRVRIRRADFDVLIEASVIGDPQPAALSAQGGKIPMPQLPVD